MTQPEYWYRQLNPTSWVAYHGNKAIAEATTVVLLFEEIKKLGFNPKQFEHIQLRIARLE